MSNHVPLPEPWDRAESLTAEESDHLEQIIGSGLTYADLSEEDGIIDGRLMFPRSPKAWAVAGHKWVRIRNEDTGEKVILRLQEDEKGDITITALVAPYLGGRALTGVDLRDIPVAALAAAFTADQVRANARMRRSLVMWSDDEIPDPLEPLPDADRSQRFLALVARQFEALEEDHESDQVAKVMADLNARPLPTVRRWIAQARKARLLAPAMPVRRS